MFWLPLFTRWQQFFCLLHFQHTCTHTQSNHKLFPFWKTTIGSLLICCADNNLNRTFQTFIRLGIFVPPPSWGRWLKRGRCISHLFHATKVREDTNYFALRSAEMFRALQHDPLNLNLYNIVNSIQAFWIHSILLDVISCFFLFFLSVKLCVQAFAHLKKDVCFFKV